MKTVGLTGGIGSGKSTVAAMFSELGVPVYDSDLEARQLMNNSEEIRREIIALMGPEAYSNSRLNREYLSKKVFSNSRLLKHLNDIVHPRVKAHFIEWARQQRAPYVIQEAAVLFENGSYSDYDWMILVKAPKEVRLHRTMARDGSSREDVMARMDHQWEDDAKAVLSDFVIDNHDLEETRSEVMQIHRELLELSA